jgi:hypothetical protein
MPQGFVMLIVLAALTVLVVVVMRQARTRA